MNTTVTYQITIQPWQIAKICTIRLSRASYNKSGRQTWTVVRQIECSPSQLHEELGLLAAEVASLEQTWRARVIADYERRGVKMSDPADTLGSEGGE